MGINKMNDFQENIDRQFEFNKARNLFCSEINSSLRFIPETILAIEKIEKIDTTSKNMLLDYVTNKTIEEFCRVNQYYSFNEKAKKDLRKIYANLFLSFRKRKYPIDVIAKTHYENLVNWLRETNPFAEKIYLSKDEIIDNVACSEYSHTLQIEILQIEINKIKSPVMDIGCGMQGNLVTHLRENGIEAYGIDRFARNDPFLIKSDWFEYEFGKNKWGTIISNLGFSNHFKHHHYRNDGDFIMYAKKYMDLLNSLKIGGCFLYAPELDFIEQYLDESKYQITKRSVGRYDFNAVKVKRLI